MAENVKVIVRCRPMNRREAELNCQCVVKMRDCTIETWDPTEGPSFPKNFTFDSVYDQNSNTEAIYNDICYPLVESVLEGYNSTIFVYGQTGCGKSHTMEGDKGAALYPEKGIISRAFEHIFEAISVTSGVKYLALASYLEIYNEQIRDLLLPTAGGNALSLKEIPNEGVTVPGLTTRPVHNVAECEQLLGVGSKNRMIGATLMNQASSRSHSIFVISIEQTSSTDDSSESIRKGKLNLVDLAGSERQAKTGATGDRLKEATKINLSLSALGNVISALVDGKAKHIPYRDSKLTRLLQDSLGGNTRTLMIACVSPASRDYVETLSTLRYANRAKNIHNKPRVNEDPKDAILRQYQQEIDRLKQLLETRQSTPLKVEDLTLLPSYEINRNIRNEDLDSKRDHLIREYETEMTKLRSLHENEKNEKQSVLRQIQLIKEEHQENVDRLRGAATSKDEIVRRIDELKAAMIGGEKANDKELSEGRRRKKMAAERRLSAIAHVLAKIDMNEDREILRNQYKDISNELDLKTEILRKYRHKVKSLEKEIQDIQGEFETERQDYLETIRKQDRNVKLLAQISERIAGTLKKECNYKDLESIKEQAIWLDDAQKFRLPELLVQRTKLPPAGRFSDVQTAPARLDSGEEEGDANFLPLKVKSRSPFLIGQNSRASPEGGSSSLPTSPKTKMDRTSKDDIIGSYFKPRRATQLLNQSSGFETGTVFNTWREYARNKPAASSSVDGLNVTQRSPNNHNVLTNSWVSGNGDACFRKPMKLEALPTIDFKRKQGRLNALDLL